MKLRFGIFDSGIGGFTVLKSLMAKRSDVEIIYLADTARNPYGGKTREEIQVIAREISCWFKDKDLDALLIACNTTNACALDILKNNLQIPCFDLINSVCDDISAKEIGVLATPATIKSSFYKDTLEAKNPGIKVFQQSCPEFVSEIEKTNLNLEKLRFLSKLYLKPLINENIKSIVLGCSHYPLIFEKLKGKLVSNVEFIDPSKSLVNKLDNYFNKSDINANKYAKYQNVEFFATGNIDEFSLKVTNWLEINKKISLVFLRTDT